MSRIFIPIDSAWNVRIQSPWFWPVTILAGLSVSFAPLFLLMAALGVWKFPAIILILCYAAITVPGWIHLRLSQAAIAGLRDSMTGERGGSPPQKQD